MVQQFNRSKVQRKMKFVPIVPDVNESEFSALQCFF